MGVTERICYPLTEFVTITISLSTVVKSTAPAQPQPRSTLLEKAFQAALRPVLGASCGSS